MDLAAHVWDIAAAMNRVAAEQIRTSIPTPEAEATAKEAARIAKYVSAHDAIAEALAEAHAYFVENSDIRDGEFGPRPNKAMELATKLSEAMSAAGIKRA